MNRLVHKFIKRSNRTHTHVYDRRYKEVLKLPEETSLKDLLWPLLSFTSTLTLRRPEESPIYVYIYIYMQLICNN